jgi:hypothetical protein
MFIIAIVVLELRYTCLQTPSIIYYQSLIIGINTIDTIVFSGGRTVVIYTGGV